MGKNNSLTRRSFVRLAASLVPAYKFAPFHKLIGLGDQEKTIYVCSPCGSDCDKLEFDKPGTCPVCGMTLIRRDAAIPVNQVPPQLLSQLIGAWAGVYTLGEHRTPVQVNIQTRDQKLTATIDLLGLEGGLSLAALNITPDGFTGQFEWANNKILLDAHIKEAHLAGTAISKGSSGTLQLIRLVSPSDIQAMRSHEGLYRAGSKTFLIDMLNPSFGFTLTELPSGMIRNLFPVKQTEFVGGSTFLAAQPEERRMMFDAAGSDRQRIILVEGGQRITAMRAPLRQEQVEFRNGDIKLSGTLILPPTPGPHPALIFMHGSGASPRLSFFGLGYLLASRGIAILKYDKRGAGESTGSLAAFTYEDLAADAIAGARMLQSRKEIDPHRIGFWGISEGAWTAPLAASRFADAGFVITLSGGGLSPAQGELLDSEDQLRTDGRFSETDIAEAIAFQKARDHYMQTGEGWEEYAKASKTAITRAWYNYPSTDLFGSQRPDSPFWRNKARSYFYDPIPALRSLRCPILCLFGALDTPAGVQRNTAAIRAALTAGGNKDFTIRVLPRANHELFETASGSTTELALAKRFVPEFFPLVTKWVEAHVYGRSAIR